MSKRLNNSLRIRDSPLPEGEGRGAATAAPTAEYSPEAEDKTVRFWNLCSQNLHREALAYAEGVLARLQPEDVDGHLQWGYSRSTAQRGLKDFAGSLVTLDLIRPLASLTGDLNLRGKYHHALAITFRKSGLYSESSRQLDIARPLFFKVGELQNVAAADNNRAVLLIAWNRPAEAHHFAQLALEGWQRLAMDNLCAEAYDTHAQAYLAEGKLTEALEHANRAVEILSAREEYRRNVHALSNARATRASIERALDGHNGGNILR